MSAFALPVTWSDIMRIVLILLLTSVLLPVYAQEENSSVTEKENTEEIKPDTRVDKNEQSKEEPLDTFDPTEKLSEDIAVDFPVDI